MDIHREDLTAAACVGVVANLKLKGFGLVGVAGLRSPLNLACLRVDLRLGGFELELPG